MKTRRLLKTPLVKQIGPGPAGAQPRAAETVSVRTAKATLSALLEKVAGGGEVVITSDGRPKARLVPVGSGRARKLFPGSADHLATMPPWPGGLDATEWISSGRDERS